MKKIISTIVLISLLTVPSISNASSSSSTGIKFKDVSTSHWANSAISTGVKKGYLSGFPGNVFKPNDPVTVAQFLKMVFMSLTDRTAGFVWWSDEYLEKVPPWHYQNLNNGTTSFEQAKPWYKNYAETARNIGVIVQDEYVGRYDEFITRERAAKIIYNLDSYFYGPIQREYAMLAGAQLFKDFNKSDFYFQEYVGDVAVKGIMLGNSQGYFNPKTTISRAEAAKICLVIANEKLRIKKQINLSGRPALEVPSPGYGKMNYLFANDEMRNTYEKMFQHQKNYSGVTNAIVGSLYYFENEEAKDKSFRSIYYFENKGEIFNDFLISFSENVYSFNLATKEGRFERSSKELSYMLSLLFKDSSSVLKDIQSSIQNARKNKTVSIDKKVEGRQLIISSTDGDYLHMAISSYKDK